MVSSATAHTTEAGAAEAPVLEASNLEKAFGTQKVLRGINLRIETGLVTVIIGGSGSGKSVLIKHLIGLLHPDAGEVRFHGNAIADMNGRDLLQFRSRMGMLFQSGALFDSMSVYENVAFPLRAHRRHLSKAEEREMVIDSLQQLGLNNVDHKFPSELSGGMRKRVGLARATILGPEIIFYDEPTTGLDPIMIHQVDDMIAETQERLKVTSIVISHDMASTFRIGHRIAMLYEGQIIAYDTPERFREVDDERVQRFINVGGTGPLKAPPSVGSTVHP